MDGNMKMVLAHAKYLLELSEELRYAAKRNDQKECNKLSKLIAITAKYMTNLTEPND